MSSSAKTCLPPVFNDQARLLIMGSLPGEASLKQQRYYGHPRNHFWALMGAVLDENLQVLDYEQRLECLKHHKVALWDVIGEAHRTGSLDANIRQLVPNDLPSFIVALRHLQVIAFNGQTASKIGRRALGPAIECAPLSHINLVDLPSSSPAYTLRFEEKVGRWSALRPFLAADAALGTKCKGIG